MKRIKPTPNVINAEWFNAEYLADGRKVYMESYDYVYRIKGRFEYTVIR